MTFFEIGLALLMIAGSHQSGNPIDYKRPLTVSVSISIITLGEPDLIKMRFRVELMAVFKWSADLRVCNYINQTGELVDEVPNVVDSSNVWLPDLHFLQAVSSRMPAAINPPVGLELWVSQNDSECDFTEKRRYSLDVQCRMDLHWFPVDVQHCPVQMESFTYSKQFLIFAWDPHFVDHDEVLQPPFRVNPAIQYLQYDVGYGLSQTSGLPWYWNQVAPGEAAEGVMFTVIFYRQFAYQLLCTYIPSTAVVVAAFSALFASSELSVERINLAAITLVSLYTQIARYRVTLPLTPYFTACDVYLYACLICIVATIVVCAVVQRFYKEDLKLERLLRDEPVLTKSVRRLSRNSTRRARKSSYLVRQSSVNSIRHYHAMARLANRFDWVLSVPENSQRNERVNILCRRVMILVYTLFLIVYFLYIFTKRPK